MEFKAKRTQKETRVTRRKLAVKRGKPVSVVGSRVITPSSAVKRRKFRPRKLHGVAKDRQATQEDLYLQYLSLNTAFLLVESALENTKTCNKRAREGDDLLTNVIILCKRAKYLDPLIPYPDFFPSARKKITYSRDFLLSLQFAQAPKVRISKCCMKANSFIRSDRQPKQQVSKPMPKPQPQPQPLDSTSEKKDPSKAVYVKKQKEDVTEEEWIIHPQLLVELMNNPGGNMAFFSKAGNILRQTVNKQVNSEICGSKPSIFQMMRHMSSSKVFVGGLSYNTDDTGLNDAFNKYGQVIEARVIMDRETGRSRGFGFVTYASSEEASAAIQALDGQELHGRNVKVNYANDRPPRTFGGGPGGYGGGPGGYGGGPGGYGGGPGGYGGGGYSNSGYGGGNYGGGGGGNYPSGGGGSSYGSNNFGSRGGADSFSAGNQSFGPPGGAGNQSFGAPGGAGGNDGGFASEFGGSSGSAPFGNNDSGDLGGGPAGGFGQNDNERNFGDDADEPRGYANKA